MVESKSVVLQMTPHTLFMSGIFGYYSQHCSLAVLLFINCSLVVYCSQHCSLAVGTVHDTIH